MLKSIEIPPLLTKKEKNANEKLTILVNINKFGGTVSRRL